MLYWPYRLYIWGTHGVFMEVIFTCFFDQIMIKPNPTLVGHSSAWSFLIFGLAPFLIGEPLHGFMRSRRTPLPLRVLVHVLTLYLWEFCWGMALVPWGANSWNYEHYRFNFMGVITLEYAPFWAFATLIFEFMFGIMERLEELPSWKKTR